MPLKDLEYEALTCSKRTGTREQESLVQVTLWCIGEYGEMLVNHMDELEGEDPQTVSRNSSASLNIF